MANKTAGSRRREQMRTKLIKLRAQRDRLSPSRAISRRERFNQEKYDRACREYFDHVRKMYPPLVAVES